MQKFWIKPLVNVFLPDGRVLYDGVPVELPEDEAQAVFQAGKAVFAEPPETGQPETAEKTDLGSKKPKAAPENGDLATPKN